MIPRSAISRYINTSCECVFIYQLRRETVLPKCERLEHDQRHAMVVLGVGPVVLRIPALTNINTYGHTHAGRLSSVFFSCLESQQSDVELDTSSIVCRPAWQRPCVAYG